MNVYLPELARTILHTLLDRYEQPQRQTVVRVRLTAKTHPAYFAPDNAAPRSETNAALHHLASQGIVQLHWQKWEQGNWLEAVDLLPAHAATLYTLLNRTPRQQQEAELHTLLAAQVPHTDWNAAFLAWAQQQLARQRALHPLNLDHPQWNADLLTALDAIARLRAPLSERALSVRLFANSKRIAELRSAIIAVLRRHDAQSAAFGDDDRALLRAHMVERIPEYVPLAGPLVLRTNATTLDLSGFEAGLALPTSLLQHSQIVACRAEAVVTVENATSFHELLPVRHPSVLAVYLGGFASPAVLTLLHNLRQAVPAITFYHWGDLDPDGLRILLHLRGTLATVQPLAMDAETFLCQRPYAQPLTTRDRAALKSLQSHPQLADCHPLIAALLHADRKLEQEAIAPPPVLCRP